MTDFEKGDLVQVTVNDRARKHLECSRFEAKIEDVCIDELVFRPIDQLQEDFETHTYYRDIGYIHGYHKSLERYSDIGKVRKVEKI